jgi:hypothetical protein
VSIRVLTLVWSLQEVKDYVAHILSRAKVEAAQARVENSKDDLDNELDRKTEEVQDFRGIFPWDRTTERSTKASFFNRFPLAIHASGRAHAPKTK